MKRNPIFNGPLVLIGCGPKAIAILAKYHALKGLGVALPKLIIVERRTPASTWDGKHGFTDGKQYLGTSPFKDIGFPYKTFLHSDEYSENLNQKMRTYSWHSYLSQKGMLADWVDCGLEPPTHWEWSRYLNWVFESVKGSATYLKGSVKRLDQKASSWCVEVASEDGMYMLEASGVVYTGTGDSSLDQCTKSDRVFTELNYWNEYLLEAPEPGVKKNIVVIGAGESAGVIVSHIVHRSEDQVLWLMPEGEARPRAEGARENKIYSQPKESGWPSLSYSEKVSFIGKTDRGVVSPRVLANIENHPRVKAIQGKANFLKDIDGQVEVQYERCRLKQTLCAEYVIVATGRNLSRSLFDLLSKETQKYIFRQYSLQKETIAFESFVQEDLSLSCFHSNLYAPGLATMTQGPGFANLSCLGLLSDRVLQSLLNSASIAPSQSQEVHAFPEAKLLLHSPERNSLRQVKGKARHAK